MNSFSGAYLRQLRKERDLTIGQLSEETGLSISYIGVIERGSANPSLEALERLSAFYSVPFTIGIEYRQGIDGAAIKRSAEEIIRQVDKWK